MLAINRGEKEGKLKVALEADENEAIAAVTRAALHPKNPFGDWLRVVCADSWNRLLFPSLERETRSELTDAANEQAIRTFALNLRPLLMQPPVRGRVTLGFNPAYRTGCKLAVVDATGKVLETAVIYPTPPHKKTEEAKKVLRRLCDKHHITCIAIGNGTPSKESEIFVADFIQGVRRRDCMHGRVRGGGFCVFCVQAGRRGVPGLSMFSLRSAVSIARRLQDPLAELVKIDPKAIGVGQYQHDMPQARLSEALDGVVEDCVNAVGVDLNTASPALLSRVAGVTNTVSKNIAAYREQNGRFEDRKQLLKVKGLGPKAFEQCAGFLRVPDGANLLDRTGVHPEAYEAAQTLLTLCGYTAEDAAQGKISELPARVKQLGAADTAKRCGVGVPTLHDIVDELHEARPRPARRAAAPDAAVGRARPERLKARHEAQGDGAQRGRLRRVCGHRRASGRAGAYLAALQPVRQAPVRGRDRRRYRGCGRAVGRSKSHRIALTMKNVK